MKWYTKAAQAGDADAQNNLADMYKDGQGVPRDLIRAYMWYTLAASANEGLRKEVAQSLAVVSAQLNAQQIVQAQDKARRCQQSHFKNCD
jgi:TPR repeat protein